MLGAMHSDILNLVTSQNNKIVGYVYSASIRLDSLRGLCEKYFHVLRLSTCVEKQELRFEVKEMMDWMHFVQQMEQAADTGDTPVLQ